MGHDVSNTHNHDLPLDAPEKKRLPKRGTLFHANPHPKPVDIFIMNLYLRRNKTRKKKSAKQIRVHKCKTGLLNKYPVCS